MLLPGQADKAADRFLSSVELDVAQQGGWSRERIQAALDALATHLAGLGLSEPDAADLAMKTWARRECADTGCFIDQSRSSAHLLWLVDPLSQQTWPISVLDLLRLIGPRSVPAAGAHGQPAA